MKRAAAGTADRHITAYDGQRRIGAIAGRDPKFVATDEAGAEIGTFATVAQAVAAIFSADEASGAEHRDDG
jgi:hypothetical protein